MTDVLRERRVRAQPAVTPRSLASTAILAGGGAALVGMSLSAVIVMAAWVLGSRVDASLTDVLRISGLGWLACHRASLSVTGGVVGVLPLGLVVLPLWLCARAGRWAVRARVVTTTRQAVPVVLAAGLMYAAIGVLVARLASTGEAWVTPLAAGLSTGVVAFIGLTVGVARASGLSATWWHAMPTAARAVIVGAIVGSLALLAVGAAASLVGLVVHLHEVTSLTRVVGGTPMGALALGVVGAAYAPTAAGWGVAYLSGVGIDLGAPAHASPFGVVPGPLPQLPWLAALPSATPQWGWLVLIAPALCGVLVALVVDRRTPGQSSWVRLGLVIAAIAGCAAIVMILMELVGGGVGPGRLAGVGPNPLLVGGACALLLLTGAIVGIGVTRLSQWGVNHRNPDPVAR